MSDFDDCSTHSLTPMALENGALPLFDPHSQEKASSSGLFYLDFGLIYDCHVVRTSSIQNAREESLKKAIQTAVRGAVEEDFKGKFHVSNTALDSERLLNSLQRKFIVHMDAQACGEAVGGLNAYYKVAIKTFVDNICRQVIERHLLSSLPDIFAPTTVMKFSNEDLIRIAAEPAKQKEKRTTLAALVQGLRDSLIALRN